MAAEAGEIGGDEAGTWHGVLEKLPPPGLPGVVAGDEEHGGLTVPGLQVAEGTRAPVAVR